METSSPNELLIESLPIEQFGVLKEIYEGYVPPDRSLVLVARKDGEIVGRVFLMEPVHVEGPWVREDLRGRTLGKRLMDAAEKEARKHGVKKLFAYAADETLADYLQRLGYQKEPYTVWTKEL